MALRDRFYIQVRNVLMPNQRLDRQSKLRYWRQFQAMHQLYLLDFITNGHYPKQHPRLFFPQHVQGGAMLEPFNLGVVVGMGAWDFVGCAIEMGAHHGDC